MENATDLKPIDLLIDETNTPAAGLFSGTEVRAPSPPDINAGFLSEIERMPHFNIPSRETFLRNFLTNRPFLFVNDS
ncbi:hypothetical protein AB1K62_02445 [Parasphingorhabdus sp. JC815]|uniref:hypothetical protein n=1 Tax=Parasphingorhabdus sp. JC815 TaxID=3232140 RepID=UPI003458AF31